ncbi:MAG TPA: selenide, water dikinase SelD [Chitinophagales bacterium]|nr:selenide, water dikinase SelD [Chitinophagales bacterium]
MEQIKLTQHSHGSGCGCKVAPAVLEEILKDTGQGFSTDKLLVGNETKDDAAVYDMGDGMALISTVDFFTPIVNDAFTYGRIAAANALSDVYAMGGKPFLAIAILGFPTEKISAEIARQIIAGGKSVCAQAGVTLAGGHTIDAPEPFFGLAVNGMVPVKNLKQNSTAKSGDLLFLTKPLGTGKLATALKRDLITEDGMQPAVDTMCTLNSFGEELGKHEYVHALTDVTGFGLLGHLIEMCDGSKLSAEINYAEIQLLPGVKDLAAKFVYADNTMRNWKAYESKVQGIGSESLLTLCDPQTSGGLLIAIDPSKERDFIALAAANSLHLKAIGTLNSPQDKTITIL